MVSKSWGLDSREDHMIECSLPSSVFGLSSYTRTVEASTYSVSWCENLEMTTSMVVGVCWLSKFQRLVVFWLHEFYTTRMTRFKAAKNRLLRWISYSPDKLKMNVDSSLLNGANTGFDRVIWYSVDDVVAVSVMQQGGKSI